ncbi:HdeD family acid-resistance protein [Aquihabitans sp. McL0605]|uniref:HdeD family acid-resistance protein n=1 Tax=Aquihabitans sp. McL0605 TaxID=3415671 RepID=UPI003CEDB811
MAVATASIGDDQIRADLRSFGKVWWLFLVTGILWLFVGFAILSFDLTSVVLISIGFSVVLFLAGIEEAVHATLMEGWRWLHGLLAVLFILGGVFAIAYPGQTFRTLAILIAWFLLIKGTALICVSLASHGMPWWWLGLIIGGIDLLIALWAIGYPGRSAVLLVLWAGIAALARGLADIVMAFQVRQLKKEVAA